MKRSSQLKRTPFKRSASTLKRTPMRRRKRPRPAEVRDDRYLAWVRQQRCASCDKGPPSHAHHKCGAGMALKAHDRESMPLCARCHAALHEFSGRFKGLSREQRAEWQDSQIERLTRLYQQEQHAA